MLRWCTGAARGLDHLHAAGFAHLDVKPANLLLGDGGAEVKLADFGTAQTKADSIGGNAVINATPRYAAPERLSGLAHDVFAADVYSYAMVVYFVTHGQPPFAGASAEEVLQLIQDSPDDRPPLDDELSAAAPSVLITVMRRCWDADPNARLGMDVVASTLAGGADVTVPIARQSGGLAVAAVVCCGLLFCSFVGFFCCCGSCCSFLHCGTVEVDGTVAKGVG